MSLSSTALVKLTQAKQYLKLDAAANEIIEAEGVGTGDGETKVFTLDNTPVSGTLYLFVNGVLQIENTDFTLSGKAITFTDAPTNGHLITAAYEATVSEDTFESYDNDLIEHFINAATRIAERDSGHAFVQREITENRVGDGTKMLLLNYRPVSAIGSVTLDGVSLTDGTEYESFKDQGYLLCNSGVWTKDKDIIITYTPGHGADRDAAQAAVPEAVTAVLLLVADMYENRGDRVDQETIKDLGSASYKLPSRASGLLRGLGENTMGIF